MRKLFYIFVVFFCLTVVTSIIYIRIYNVNTIVFHDRNLEAAVREELGKTEGKLHKRELAQITVLNAVDKEIKRLDGIENLKRLAYLDLEDNFIEDVTPLVSLIDLEYLSLRNNEITDLDAINFSVLKELRKLTTLSLRHNVYRPDPDNRSYQYRLSDISMLKDFQALEVLELRDNHIEDIQAIGPLKKLRILDISQNPIRNGNIEILSELTELTELNIRECGIAFLDPLAALTSLTYLNIHSNSNIQSIKPIQSLTGLKALIMRDVPLGDEVRYISSMTRLTQINIRNCEITDLSVLVELMQAGALQDNLEKGIKASVDIRDNPVPEGTNGEPSGYDSIRTYWQNISERYPKILPGQS